MKFITIRDVRKQFLPQAAPALDGVSLDISRGEVFGIIGRSGAGKSTLVRLINGLETPDTGVVRIGDVVVSGLDAEGLRLLRRRVSMIFQSFGLLSSATAADNVAFPLRMAGEPAKAIAARVVELLALVGLSAQAEQYPVQLSGGQKQRVGIARALATRPEILLCDEATSALDPETTREVLTLVAALNVDLGLTIVLITHEMDVVRQICDRVAVLQAGRVVETGTVADVMLTPQHPETQALLATGGVLELDAQAFNGQIVRFTVLGDDVATPMISRIAQATGTDISILDGRIGRLKGQAYGQLTLGLAGGDINAALAMMGTRGRICERPAS